MGLLALLLGAIGLCHRTPHTTHRGRFPLSSHLLDHSLEARALLPKGFGHDLAPLLFEHPLHVLHVHMRAWCLPLLKKKEEGRPKGLKKERIMSAHFSDLRLT